MSTTDSSPTTIEDVETRYRAELVAGLREATDFIDGHPGAVSSYGGGVTIRWHVAHRAGFDAAVAALDHPPVENDGGDYVMASRRFGPVTVGVQALAAEVSDTCPECHGGGEVTVNPSSDPQEAYESPCPSCHGDGVRS